MIHSRISNSSARILRQLYFLRNITITFIILMVVLALFGLGINLPVIPLTIILLIMAVTNLVTRYIIDSSHLINDRTVFFQLLLEILSFTLILFFAGGATNPFTFFYLIPLAIAATVIPGKATAVLTGLTILLYSLLLKYYVPLNYAMEGHDHGAENGQFSQHVLGMWFGFLVSAILVTWFITYLAKELKRRDRKIVEARQRELRDQQMVTLGTLAAGTAHELGTPLASLAIIAGDLTDGYDQEKDAELFANQRIIKQQVQRCKKILSVLSDSAGESRAESGYLMDPEEFLQQCLDHWEEARPGIDFGVHIEVEKNSAQLLYDPTITQAIINLLNNAADACNENLKLIASIDDESFEIDILDQGDGISDNEIKLAGETSFSSKPHGMGIGLFLALTTIRRCQGSVSFQRREGGGTLTRIKLPLIKQRT